MNGKIGLIIGIAVCAIVGISFLEPIPQDLAYHKFVDIRSWLGVPNTLDVLSNLPFAIVGILGLLGSMHLKGSWQFPLFVVLFVGVFMTAFGSSYYHWMPNNETLVWDRLPMTIAFMGLFTLVLADRLDTRCRHLLIPLLLFGVFSVFYWDWTETQNRGDLRWYALVQFLPILLLPIILLSFKSKCRDGSSFVGLIIFYGLAKVLEYFDGAVFDATGIVSGHTLKHLSAGLATAFLYQILLLHINAYRTRKVAPIRCL